MKITEIKRKKGVVYQSVVDLGYEDGKRVQRRVTARTKRDLKEAIDKLRLERPSGLQPRRGKDTLGQLADRWLESVKGSVENRTYASYADIVDAFIKPKLGTVRLQSLVLADIEEAKKKWLDTDRRDQRKEPKTPGPGRGRKPKEPPVKRKTLKLSKTTVRYILTILRMVLNYGVLDRAIITNYAKLVRMPKAEDFPSKILKPEQFAMVLEFARTWREGDVSLHLLLAGSLGLRRGELCGLTWGDIDLDASTVTIRRAIEVRRGGQAEAVVAGKESRLREKSPKGGRVATLPIPSIVIEALRDWQERQLDRLGAISPATPVLDRNGGWAHPDTIGKSILKCIGKSGAPKVRLHDLRHSFGSWLANAGVSMRVMQEQMRHRSGRMTEHYTQRVEPAQRAAADEMDRLLRATRVGRENYKKKDGPL